MIQVPIGTAIAGAFMAVGQAVAGFFGTYGAVISTGAFIAQGIYAHKAAMKAKRMGADILLQKYGTGQGMPIIYGSRRVGSTVVYMETKNNKELFVVYALAGHELDSFDLNSIQLDGRTINDDEIYRQGYDLSDGTTRIRYRNDSATITSGTYWGNTSAERSAILAGANDGSNARMTFNLHHGTTSQAADPMLSGILDNWTSNHKLTGIAYIAANYEYDTKGMFSGIPNLSIVVKGKKVYDPRKDTAHGGTGSHDFDTITTYEWSDNAALCLLDYITNDEYGKGLGEADIDMSSFQTAATDSEATVDTISHTLTVNSASIDSDVLVIASTSETAFKKLKVGNLYTVTAGATTHINNKKLLSQDFGETELVGGNRRPVYRLSFEKGAVDTAITTATSCTFTETERRFHCNGVIDTDESVIDNTKLLISNMRGIFTYSNGKYSIDVEGTETPVQTLTEDHILDAGIQLNLESKEQKYNKVETEFFNSQKKYETDTAYYTGESTDTFLADDGNEILETRVQFPFVTNQRIAYNHAVSILKRSRSQRTISFLCSPRVLKSRVGEVIAINNTNLDLSAEQYRITNMTIQPDLNIEVTAIEYQGGIYDYNDPPDEDLGILKDPVESNRVEAPSNFNFNQKSGSTPAYLSWDDGNTYPSYEFAVKVYDSTNQSGNVIRDGRVKETRFYLPELPKANGYSALVVAINSLGIESEDTLLNSFNVTVDPVINDDIGGGAVDTPEIAQGAIGGMKFTETKAYYGTGTFDSSDTPFYVDTSSNFSLGSALSFNGTTLTIGGYASDADISDFITGAEVNANVTNISGGVIQTGTVAAARIDVSGVITAGSIIVGGDNISNLTNDSGFTDFDATDVESAIANNVTVISGSKITTGTINASLVSVTNITADNINAGTLNVDRLSIDGTTITAVAGELLVGIIDQDNISVINLSAINSDLGAIDAGSLNINSGQFVVTSAGAMTAQSANVTGTITSSAGTIGGFTLGSTSLTAGSGSTRVSLSTADGIHLGNDTFSSAPFRVTRAGALTATNATITGNITATTLNVSGATVTGTLDASVITLDGQDISTLLAYPTEATGNVLELEGSYGVRFKVNSSTQFTIFDGSADFNGSPTVSGIGRMGIGVGITSGDVVTVNGQSFLDSSGELYINGSGNGIHLFSPNGTEYKLTVTNSGTLSVSAV
jgi:hypothetical protein